MNGARESRQPGLTRRKLTAGFIGIAALVSTVAMTARPAPPPVETTAPIETVEPVEIPQDAPTPSPNQTEEAVIESVRVRITCYADTDCLVNPVETGGAQDTAVLICVNRCGRNAGTNQRNYTLTPGGQDRAGRSLPVIQGVRRDSPTNHELIGVEASTEAPTDFVGIETDGRGVMQFESVGDADMTYSVNYIEAPAPNRASQGESRVGAVLSVLAVVVLVVLVAIAALMVFVTLVQALIDLAGGKGTSRYRREEVDDEEDADDVPVDAPLALAQPITKEVAEERAAVAQDLLDRVRDINDPRLSIQTGFSLLETGFGRMHLARRRNETSKSYITRVFGDHEDLRPTMFEITGLFERARYSDMPVDAEMRGDMIRRLEDVQATWEQEAFILSDTPPAPPAPPDTVSVLGSDAGRPIEIEEELR